MPVNFLRGWFVSRFSDPQAIVLAVILLVGLGIVVFFGDILMPALASAVVAYLLDGLAQAMERRRAPRFASVMLIYIFFLAMLFGILLGLLPLLSQQITQLFQQLPAMIAKGQALMLQLPEHYPQIFSEQQVKELITGIRTEAGNLGQQVLSLSVTSLVGLITLGVYLILVPILVFFFLKDKERLFGWVHRYLPDERQLAEQVWHEMDRQLGNYVRGKFFEILIVWLATYLTFAYMGVQFAMLLAVLVGLSVIIPYVGAVVVTFPVALVAYFQWGWSADFAYLVGAYLVIQMLDGNVLVPLLFSEVVNLHPIAIIIAVLFFGGVWGIWGVFFAIPLATLIQAVLNAWPAIPAKEQAPA